MVFLRTTTGAMGIVYLFFAMDQAMGAIPVPSSLDAGDKYHLAFISSERRDGTSGNAADYNALVQAVADDANIGISEGVVWSAMVSTGDANSPRLNARDHAIVGTNTAVFNMNLDLVAQGFSDMWDGALKNTLQWDEKGIDLGIQDTWTGSLPDGTADPNEYLGSSAPRAWCGRTTETGDAWFHFSNPFTSMPLNVYGLSQELTVPGMCDFDGSGTCGLSDINLMIAQGNLVAGVPTNTATEKFDLVDNNIIDDADITEWLDHAGTDNGYSAPALRGDTDGLNDMLPAPRTVDITDFQNFLIGFTGAGSTWETGNFDGDSDVDITDFSNHFLPNFVITGGGTYGVGPAIPEPQTVILLGFGELLFLFLCRDRWLNRNDRTCLRQACLPTRLPSIRQDSFITFSWLWTSMRP